MLMIVAVGASVLGAALLYLFRWEREDNPALGRITRKYNWGKAHQLVVDADRDGRIDGRYVVAGSFGSFSPHDRVVDGRESSRCDGTMDLHLLFDPLGRLATIEYDSDQDGKYDQFFRGSEAAEFLRSMPRPRGCGRSAGAIDSRGD
jgi:hypothetical protein